jgi:hypothetical protein
MSFVKYWKLSDDSVNIAVAILYILRMATAMLADTLDNFQYLKRLIL